MSTHPFSSNPFSVGAAFPFQNPFAAPAAEPATKSAALEDGSYVMVQSAPHVASEEVESAHLDAVEVVVKWGDNVLHVEHLSPVRPFTVGEEGADYILSSDMLGGLSMVSLVSIDDGVARVSPPMGVVVTRTKADGSVDSLSGASNMALEGGSQLAFAIPGSELRFEVSAVRAGKKIETGFLSSISLAAHKFTALSFVGHAALFAAFAFFMPKMSADDDANISRDNILYMQKMLDASAMREQEEQPQDQGADSAASGGQGQRAKDDEGMLGKTTPTTTTGRFGIQGHNPNPELQRKADIAEARDFGMVGILNMMAMDKNAPAAAWGAESAQGNDDKSALGNMFGASIDDAAGAGGVGLSGTGEGGGGNGEGVGLDSIGPLGHGAGGHPGQGIGPGGMGISSGRLQRPHNAKQITLREAGPLTAGGHLPSEVIQRVVRQNFGRFRNCYEAGLRGNPGLTGRVQVKFVIGRDGAVSIAQDGGSDLPDQSVVSCVVRNYQSLSFPSPDNGVVTVTYPIIFTPGE